MEEVFSEGRQACLCQGILRYGDTGEARGLYSRYDCHIAKLGYQEVEASNPVPKMGTYERGRYGEPVVQPATGDTPVVGFALGKGKRH